MANTRTKTYTLVGLDLSAAGIAAAQASTANVAFTLLAAAAALDPPRRVSITSAADVSAVVFSIVGKDRWGNAQTETVTGVNTNTVTTKSAFSSVTSITPSATDTDTASAGWPIGGQTPWVLCGRGLGIDQVPEALISVLTLTGSPTANAEATYTEFPTKIEAEIAIDTTIAVTPGTPVTVQAGGARVVLTSGAATSVTVKFLRSGP